jgi:hypothetical protein
MLSRVLSRTLRSACARPASWSLSRATGGSIRLFSGTKQFAESHEYIDADGLIGITDHAQELLGDICYVDFPEIGDSFKAGDVVVRTNCNVCALFLSSFYSSLSSFYSYVVVPQGYIESSKTVHDFYAPCDIEIVAVNETLGAARVCECE